MTKLTSNRALSLLYSFLNYYQKQDKYIVLLPSNICHDVFFLILHLELSYVLFDIEEDNLCINRQAIKNFFKINNKAILLYNHTYGNPHIPYDFFEEVKGISSDAVIIDDRCLCLPTKEITPKDEIIDLIIYSTGKRKQIDLGGGAFAFIKGSNQLPLKQIVFDDQRYTDIKSLFNTDINKLLNNKLLLKNCLIFVKNEKWHVDDYVDVIKREETDWSEHKKILVMIYESSLPKEIQLPTHFNNWRFNISVKNKQLILESIFEKNLFASSHYPSIGTKMYNGHYNIANKLHHNILNLFIDKHYTEEMGLKTARIINQYLHN